MSIEQITNQTRIQETIASIGDKFTCLPFLSKEEDIVDYLKTCQGNMAHPTPDGYIIAHENGTLYKFKVPSADMFRSQISSTDAAMRAQENMRQFGTYSNLENISGFSSNQIATLRYQLVTEPTQVSARSTMIMITHKGSGQFLDFVVYTDGSSVRNCNYSGRSIDSLQHCGDIHFNGYLFHSVKLNSNKCSVCLGGVGYSKTPLMAETYTNQKPSMSVYDPEVNTIYILPFQQTRAILGNTNTALISGVINFQNDEYTLVPLTITSDGRKYNTTDIPNCDMVVRAFREACAIMVRASQRQTQPSPVVRPSVMKSKSDSKKLSNVFQFSTTGDYMELHSSNFDYLGNMTNFKNGFNPSLFGPTKNSVFYGSISPSTGDVSASSFYESLSQASVVVLHFSEDDITSFTEECAGLIEKKITCLMILTVDFGNSRVSEKLENLNLSCTKYANQYSIILAKCKSTGTHYWIRGIRWCHEKIYKFGEEFTDLGNTIRSALQKETPFQINQQNCKAYYNHEFVDISSARDFVEGMPYEMMIDNQKDLVELIIQMSVVISTKDFNEFKMSCLRLLKTKQFEATKASKLELKSLLQKKLQGDTSKELQHRINELISSVKKNRACTTMKDLTSTIISMTSEGAASSKAAGKSLENTLRSEAVKQNVGAVNDMTQESICEYLEEIDQFVIGQINPNGIQHSLEQVSSGTFNEPQLSIASLHGTCGELDGFTVSALSVQSGQHGHDFEGVLAMLCGESEIHSSIPIAVLPQFSELDDPRHFKWIEEVNEPDVAKFRILLRRMVCEAACNRTRHISPASVHLSKFLLGLFLSVAQSIRIRFSSVPTDATDFTVIAMRTLLGFAFTTLASGSVPMSNMWQVLSKYPTHIPQIDAFNRDDLWILENLVDMFPYCMWGCAEANFKKNSLCGIIKLLSKFIITSELEVISQKEKMMLASKNKEIHTSLTIVWQWQKLVILSILKMYSFKTPITETDSATFKKVAKKLYEDYPDVDESTISVRHSNRSSTRNLKSILRYIEINGDLNLSEFQCQIIKSIVGKRMHHYYQTKSMTKSERSEYLSKIDMTKLSQEFKKVVSSKFTDENGGKIWEKSWRGQGDNTNDSIENTLSIVKSYFNDTVTGASTATVHSGGSSNTELVSTDKFPDIRQKIWLTLDTPEKVSTFLARNNLSRLMNIMNFIFPDKDVNRIITDIADELLTNYKDRTKAYGNILLRYKFD